ncbi:hypothetical protein Pla123a_34090 [Posidoniimonas polymericola]|uniref:PEP-CTERM protein-sorting domain-containing protein n=1 Tax=Posidoniimonas polymericola TaxID=2528002 RepID=A0A5C5YI86_9BACT|nr:hypothetical protein [Posidoniimonas polymericola]TWT74585.1 hypothetical protein Pla123a_34090 [Posidoniimonas polymericola]
MFTFNAVRLLEVGFMGGLLALVGAASGTGAVIVTASPEGPDVVVAGGGTLNLGDGLFTPQLFGAGGGILPAGEIVIGPPATVGVDGYVLNDFRGPLSFGVAGVGPSFFPLAPTSGSGDTFGVEFGGLNFGFGGLVITPLGYTPGTPLVGSSTYAGRTLSSLGLAPGEYRWSWGSGGGADSFTLRIVPAPSAAALLVIGMGGGLLVRTDRSIKRVGVG